MQLADISITSSAVTSVLCLTRFQRIIFALTLLTNYDYIIHGILQLFNMHLGGGARPSVPSSPLTFLAQKCLVVNLAP